MMVRFLFLEPNNTEFLKYILPRVDERIDDATEVEYMYETAYLRMCYRTAFWVSNNSTLA